MADKETLEEILATTQDSTLRDMATKQLEELAAENNEDVTSQLVGLSSLLSNVGVDDKEVKKLIKAELDRRKITIDDLDKKLKDIIDGIGATVNVTIQQGSQKITKQVSVDASTGRPLIQKVLSDVAARNNAYLYGGAGTGKTYAAQTIKDALGWELITISCNQFTSTLELIGGQTIDGYQEGKVIRAFANLNEDGTPMVDEEGNPSGCVLLLDELPKLDPNTAGVLNAALAKAGEYVTDKKTRKKVPAKIENARGEKFTRKNVFIMGTGNSLLNTADAEYEANFKQDLSLQDRFAGSTYQVFVDKKFEWNNILERKWAFIYIYLSKLRKAIVDEGFTAKAFVSIRLMMSAQKTYNVYRAFKDAKGSNPTIFTNPDISFTPAAYVGVGLLQKSTVKSIQDTIDEFFILFTEEQRDILKKSTNYKDFLKVVKAKDKVALDDLNTPDELVEVDKIIKE